MIKISEKILIVDYGSQYTQLIARKIREQKVYCVVYPYNKINSIISKDDSFVGMILSGGPNSVNDKNSPKLNKKIINKNVPILGICYGLQLICKEFMGEVGQSNTREYGHTIIKLKSKSLLFDGVLKTNKVWMSHGD